MTERAVLPYGRATVFSAVCVGLAVAAHATARGAALPAGGCVIGVALVFALARIVAVRQRGLASITFLMLGCQAGLHLVFDAVPGTRMPPMTGMGDMGDMGAVAHDPSVGDVMTPAVSHTNMGMLAGHVVAALAVSWWLRHGEAMAFRLAALLASMAMTLCHALLSLLGGVVRATLTTTPTPLPESSVPAAGLIRFTVVRRGPPPKGSI